MEESQDSSSVSSSAAAANRRHSVDGSLNLRPSDCFHPYRRQFSDGVVVAAGRLPPCSASFSGLQEACSSDLQSLSDNAPLSWEQHKGSAQSSYPELPAAPAEPLCFLSQSHLSHSFSYPLPQVSSRIYPQNGSNNSKYSLHSISTTPHQEGAAQSMFPKPIYSYSILIFMALKNSKTGSLPVSEIYSFMTEHFPYFKTAPDGWKNSVRHNLSLNKCFEKVENKNGSSSRKGCLWALNPAKVEKMQEELHKWRRKDPMTMRRSMARPEDLDRLLGERKERLKTFPRHNSSALLSRVPPFYGNTPSSCSIAHLRPVTLPIPCSQYAHIQAPQPCYLPPAAAAHSNTRVYAPCGQQPTATGSLNSMSGKMPPFHSAALQADCGAGLRSMQDLLLEADNSYDIDTLNPTLTDLQLQGHLWEELKDDSLNPASEQNVTTSTSSVASTLQDHLQNRCLQVAPLVSQGSTVTPAGRCRVECEDRELSSEQHGCLAGLHPVVYSGVESLAGYLTSCTTSISLM